MNKILGIGGLFFRTKDPVALKKWYTDVLGVVISENVWQQEAALRLDPALYLITYAPADQYFAEVGKRSRSATPAHLHNKTQNPFRDFRFSVEVDYRN
jgi:hypothetical protein